MFIVAGSLNGQSSDKALLAHVHAGMDFCRPEFFQGILQLSLKLKGRITYFSSSKDIGATLVAPLRPFADTVPNRCTCILRGKGNNVSVLELWF
jgi:hypothetical protein